MKDGYEILPNFLTPAECNELSSLYDDPTRFRSRVVMSQHGFGQGEYQYFGYPLPPYIGSLRTRLYADLVSIANTWTAEGTYPPTHEEFLERCHGAGQTRPTPLLLRYGPGDYNCLHQDLYGALVFPIQVAVLLSQPGIDFDGGEFVLTEQRPRRQSRVEVVPLRQGDAVAFAVSHRPTAAGRVTMRHGVSQIRSGNRTTLGIIFHDST